jgi:thioredoxin:protein disulfide reductase
LLPSTGAWMANVKTFFGMLLLAVALWLVQPVLPVSVTLFLLGLWLILGAAFLGAFNGLDAHASMLKRAFKGLGWVLLLLAALQIVGSLVGATNPLQPLQPLMGRLGSPSDANRADTSKLAFKRISSLDELNAAIKAAQGRPVMLDFYADWCVACKEMEHFTFSDASVQARLTNVVLLQADVTANNAQDKALMKQFGLFGPPGILFFDGKGQEKVAARVIGYQNPQAFLNSLDAAGV